MYVSFYLWYIYIVIKGRGTSAGALAPATGHAPTRIPNRRRLRGGALAQRLQHLPFFFGTYVALLSD